MMLSSESHMLTGALSYQQGFHVQDPNWSWVRSKMEFAHAQSKSQLFKLGILFSCLTSIMYAIILAKPMSITTKSGSNSQASAISLERPFANPKSTTTEISFQITNSAALIDIKFC